jgi:electron transfer flavoprotein alpha subunit
VLGRAAAALGAGLVGDAVGIEVVDDELVAAKPAFSGALLADIVCTSDVRLVSVRPGVLPLPLAARGHTYRLLVADVAAQPGAAALAAP